ncbi:MAG: thiamine diphosphokinase [Bacteroidaceae bacterium]|nr:thiamine diphosphokinase [Bacteroidaceae bacterium]
MIKNFKNIDAVILANGEYPTAETPKTVLANAPYVVCCDGAANRYIETGRVPDAIVGDGDSLKEEFRQQYASIIHHVNEQESNDQTKAVRFLLAQGKHRIAIVGATGKREDHTLGNISLLIEYARMGAEVRTFTDYGVFIPCKGKCTMPSTPGQQISIFSFTAKGSSSKGLKYPIFDFTNWWQGTLNECMGNEFTIDAEGEYLLFINY